jgi:hypothetical protein
LAGLCATSANAVILQVENHPRLNDPASAIPPSWNMIPDLAFTCRISEEKLIKIVISHKERELYIDGQPVAVLKESNPVWNMEQGDLMMEWMIAITLMRGPGWTFSDVQGEKLLLMNNNAYHCR